MRNTPLRAFAKKSPLNKMIIRKDTDWMDMEIKRKERSPVRHEGFGEHVHKEGGSGSYDKESGKQTGVGGDIDTDTPKSGSGDAALGAITSAISSMASLSTSEPPERGDAPSMKMNFGRR